MLDWPEQICPVIHLTQYSVSDTWPVTDDLDEDERLILDNYKVISLRENICYHPHYLCICL